MLRAFDAYGRSGGIRSAAKMLNIDHAVVSRHLSALEAFVGTELIDRRMRRLNPDGEQFHRRISAALEEIGNATLMLRKRYSEEMLIWCSPGFAFHWLNPRLKLLEQLSEALEFELRPSDRPPNLRSNDADGDIRYLRDDEIQSDNDYMRSVVICTPAVFPVASRDYAASIRGRLSSAEDLLELDLLHEESDTEWRLWLQQQGLRSLPATLPGSKLWHAHLSLDAARSGRGIALANRFLVHSMLETGEMVKVMPEGEPFRPAQLGSYYFMARADRWSSRGLARLRNWLLTTADDFNTD
tara:strand:+ start:31905 stop:32798 length:894 start_codon:yes stop_codon:yes gene_type:complete